MVHVFGEVYVVGELGRRTADRRRTAAAPHPCDEGRWHVFRRGGVGSAHCAAEAEDWVDAK